MYPGCRRLEVDELEEEKKEGGREEPGTVIPIFLGPRDTGVRGRIMRCILRFFQSLGGLFEWVNFSEKLITGGRELAAKTETVTDLL